MSTQFQPLERSQGAIRYPSPATIMHNICEALQNDIYSNNITISENDVHQHFVTIDSTQPWAKEKAKHLEPDLWFIFTANEQTKGRGSCNRKWLSPPDVNLHVTFAFPFPRSKVSELVHVSQITAIGVARTLKHFGFEPEIRWPTDILLNGKKVSKILCESGEAMKNTDFLSLIAGIGLNINMDQAACDSIDIQATSLKIERGYTFDRDEVFSILYKNVKDCINQLITYGFSQFSDEVNRMMAFKMKRVTVDFDGSAPQITGTFTDIGPMGNMILQTDDGTQVSLDNGRIIKTY